VTGGGGAGPGPGPKAGEDPVGRRGGRLATPSSRVSLGTGEEFDLIRRLLGPETPLPPGVLVGPGDDCAALEGGVVVSADLFVEEVHFKREWISLREAGYRATAAALSDLAAMAAEPLGVLLSMALGPGNPREDAAELQAGAGEACRREGISILGGDLAGSPGPVVLDVVVLGRARVPVLRSGSFPGDEMWVTGWLGGSAGAVALWSHGLLPPEGIRTAFARPRPRIREALWLAERVSLHALLDISDGLAGDAGHLAAASGVSVVLEEEAIPVYPNLAGLLAGTGEDPLAIALGGGEDYELCFTVSPDALEAWAAPFEAAFGIPLTRVGKVEEGDGRVVLLESGRGERRPLERRGFSHFVEKGRE
jgi:thiamine-monophosphate kinase